MLKGDTSVASVVERYRAGLAPLYEEGEVKAIVRTIFHGRLGWDAGQLEINRQAMLSQPEFLEVLEPLERLSSGEPLQYVMGEVRFHGLRLKVDRSVLIPRPETEEMVDLIVRGTAVAPRVIVDIGTGSGCIALALKRHYPDAAIIGIDRSMDALRLAHANGDLNGLPVEWRLGDVLGEDLELPGTDLLVSNPPYVPRGESSGMSRRVVDHEPHEALFVPDEDPMVFYRAISMKAKGRLNKGGSLWFEGHHRTAPQVRDLLLSEGWANVELIADLSGLPRFIHASR